MKLILEIAAGVLLAKLTWFCGELIVAAVAAHAAQQTLEESIRKSNQSHSPTQLVSPSPPAASLPRLPSPSNDVPVGSFACMNGVTMRHETNGWTQVSGSASNPTCAR